MWKLPPIHVQNINHEITKPLLHNNPRAHLPMRNLSNIFQFYGNIKQTKTWAQQLSHKFEEQNSREWSSTPRVSNLEKLKTQLQTLTRMDMTIIGDFYNMTTNKWNCKLDWNSTSIVNVFSKPYAYFTFTSNFLTYFCKCTHMRRTIPLPYVYYVR